MKHYNITSAASLCHKSSFVTLLSRLLQTLQDIIVRCLSSQLENLIMMSCVVGKTACQSALRPFVAAIIGANWLTTMVQPLSICQIPILQMDGQVNHVYQFPIYGLSLQPLYYSVLWGPMTAYTPFNITNIHKIGLIPTTPLNILWLLLIYMNSFYLLNICQPPLPSTYSYCPH